MKTCMILPAIIAAALLLTAPGRALAQAAGYRSGGSSGNLNGPTVSPYLNLLQTNNQGFVPYQSLVQPQIEQANALNRQAGAIQQLQQQVNASGTVGSGGRGTGHATFFMNYSHFYSGKGAAAPQRR
jgi:hypothetical protein